MAGRTSIIVAHRLATVRNATKIAVVHRGRVSPCMIGLQKYGQQA